MSKLFLDANLAIYLNTITGEERAPLDRFFKSLLRNRLFTNLLALDETLCISKRRYTVPYDVTFNFLKRVLLPYAEIVPIGEEDLQAMERYLTEYDMKPADAIHLASMDKTGTTSIVSEDTDFDSVRGIKRVWLDKIR